MIFKGMISAELFQELVESRSQSCFSRPSQGDKKTEQSKGALTRAGAGQVKSGQDLEFANQATESCWSLLYMGAFPPWNEGGSSLPLIQQPQG